VSEETQRASLGDADLGDTEPMVQPSVSRDDLERAIIGDEPTLTAEELIAAAGCTLPDARRLWRAFGFAAVSESAPAFTAADRDAIMLVTWLVDSGVIDFDTAVRLIRAVGNTMARLADWQVSTLTEYVEGLEQAGLGTGSRLTTGLDMIRSVEPPFEELVMYAYRRHLAAAVTRVEALGARDSDLHTMTATVGFADMVSFTQLSNGMDQDRLADVVEDFESTCSDLLTRHGARLIKTLGDSVLFTCDTPEIAVEVATDIVEEIGGDSERPDVHVGLATGPVVMRLGDAFGPPVNLASRLTGVARRNRVICDVATADALREVPGVVLRPLTERAIRGFGVVTPVAVRRLVRDGG
jgi:adenylate cyclase